MNPLQVSSLKSIISQLERGKDNGGISRGALALLLKAIIDGERKYVDLRIAKARILKCLTEDIEYGRNKKTGAPLKRKKRSSGLFNAKAGDAVWRSLNLAMVMDKVVLGLHFALEDSSNEHRCAGQDPTGDDTGQD